MPTLIEIKAHCSNPLEIRQILESKQADFKGTDHQIDTYFVVPEGRLKLRQGNIENTFIHYNRNNQAGPKKSEVSLYKPIDDEALKNTLLSALEVLVVVDKMRHIYFIDNVKFHVDEVIGLGSFTEIEAIDEDGSIEESELLRQCQQYMKLLDIKDADLVEVSYSDLLLKKNK
jgi:predicted adenylyl cyclase CyaB